MDYNLKDENLALWFLEKTDRNKAQGLKSQHLVPCLKNLNNGSDNWCKFSRKTVLAVLILQ